MFKRPHHQIIARILCAMDASFLRATKCYFGGGTAIALQLDEFRESVDIDFLCADQEGYRKLRESIFAKGLEDLFPGGIRTLRDVRADRDGIRAILIADQGVPVKFEIVREGRIDLEGQDMPNIAVPCLARNDLFAEKLLANADRYADKAVLSRDMIDLLMMEQHWGPTPDAAWDKAAAAYGNAVQTAFQKARDMLRADRDYLNACLEKMGIAEDHARLIRCALGDAKRPPTGCRR